MKKPDNILRLKYRLEPKENNIVEFEILYQDKKLTRTNQYGDFMHGKFNQWNVASCLHPQIFLSWDDIYIRGTQKEKDNYISVFMGHHLIPSIHKALELFIKSKFGNCKVIKG